MNAIEIVTPKNHIVTLTPRSINASQTVTLGNRMIGVLKGIGNSDGTRAASFEVTVMGHSVVTSKTRGAAIDTAIELALA